MKLYLIRRQDFFVALGKGQLPQDIKVSEAGSLWMQIFLTQEQKENYPYPIYV